MGADLSGSKIDIFLNCQWAFSEAFTPPPEGERGYNRGTVVHDYVAGVLTGRYPEVPGEDPEAGAFARAVLERIESEGAKGVEAEVAYAWDTDAWSARLLGFDIGRDYGELKPTEIPGTIDLVWMDGDTLVVADIKTYPDVTPPEENGQLLFAALCLADIKKHRGPIRAEIWFAKPNRVWIESAGYAQPNLFKLAGDIETRRGLKVVNAVPGEHCRWCPANGRCPATQRALVGLTESPERWDAEIVSQAQASWMASRLPAVKKALEEIERRLKEYADDHDGIELENGKVWRATVQRRSSLNTAAVKDFLGDRISEFMSTVEVKAYRAVKR